MCYIYIFIYCKPAVHFFNWPRTGGWLTHCFSTILIVSVIVYIIGVCVCVCFYTYFLPFEDAR